MTESIFQDIEALKPALRMQDPREAAWLLFKKNGSDLDPREVYGLFIYDLLVHLGFSKAHTGFVVNQVLDWALKEISESRPAIIQFINQRFLTYTGKPSEGFHAWDLEQLKEADWRDMPIQPLISLAISLKQLHKDTVKMGGGS